MTTRLDNLRVNRVAMVDRGADQDADILLYKRLEGASGPSASHGDSNVSKDKEHSMPDLNLEALPEDLRQHFEGVEMTQEAIDALAAAHSAALDTVPEAAQTELDTAKATAKRLEDALKNDDDDDDSDDDVTKGMTPEAAAEFKKMSDQNSALEKRLDSEVEKREIREFTEVAVEKYSHVPGADPDELGPILYRMHKNTMTEDDVTKFEEMLQGASKAAKANTLLTQELGRASSVPTSDAEGVIDGIAKRLQAEDSELTYEAAYAKALETPEGKEAFAQNRIEKRAGVND